MMAKWSSSPPGLVVVHLMMATSVDETEQVGSLRVPRQAIYGGSRRPRIQQRCAAAYVFSDTSSSLSASRPSSGKELTLIFRIRLLRWTFTDSGEKTAGVRG
jgi:hypothetical protein